MKKKRGNRGASQGNRKREVKLLGRRDELKGGGRREAGGEG